jgi:hypothetical protein
MNADLPTTRRGLGRIYTPPAIARKIVRGCLDRWDQCADSSPGATGQTACRILDPACGDGAFLLEVFDELWRRSEQPAARCDDRNQCAADAFRLGLVRDHIFGVDIDQPAVEALRMRLLERIVPPGNLTADAADIVNRNIRCGDSLTGSPWKKCQEPFRDLIAEKAPDTVFGAIDWQRDFPAAAGAGGFDIIVGNPPYRRERNAKALFDTLAATELGRSWREARMDLWYYFVHRGLDLLRPGGILSFIVNSYWMSSRGAAKLIARLQRESLLEEIELLDDAPIFKGIAGRHMIFRLQKRGGVFDVQPPLGRDRAGACRIVVAPRSQNRRRQQIAAPAPESGVQAYSVPLDDLFQNGRLIVAPVAAKQSVFRGRPPLRKAFATRQGMAENPPAINRRLQRQFPGQYALGEGVFVLKADEVERLNLSPAERGLLRPYYETTAVRRYRLADVPTHSVVYLTRHTAPRLEDLPNVAAHLARYRPILERRRETRQGKCAWWRLHWPREEEIFLQPRILSVQMGHRPQFVFAERPTFVGFSINLILPGEAGSLSLEALTGILNSNLAQDWFDRQAKRRGVNLEINAHVLREFPLPGREDGIESRIGKLVRARQALAGAGGGATEIEQEIEELVGRLYKRENRDGADPNGASGVCLATPPC